MGGGGGEGGIVGLARRAFDRKIGSSDTPAIPLPPLSSLFYLSDILKGLCHSSA